MKSRDGRTVQKGNLPEKTCVQCARPMIWRRKWEKTWGEVKYCSDRCRSAARTGPPKPGGA